MQSRLLLCTVYLEEIEAKLKMLLKEDETSRISEALKFVQQARKSIAEAQSRIPSESRTA